MASSGPTKACPRCNAALPAPATFCGACGWQFSASASPAAASAPAGGPAASGAWPQSQPTVQAPAQSQPPAMPGYPMPVQPGPAGYAPVAVAASPKPGIPPKVIAIILVGFVLTIGIPAYLVFGGQGGGGLLSDRHGLPSNVPLPSGVTFKAVEDASDSGGAAKEWYWLVASPNDPTALRNFYQSNLPSNGWSNIQTRGSDGDYEVDGCGSHQGIYVEMVSDQSVDVDGAHGDDPHTLAPPAGGAVLQMIVGSSQSLLSYSNCG